MNQRDEFYISIRPKPRQVAYQQMEFYGFIHFTINTYTDREWGDGSEDPQLFNPREMNAGQWAWAAKAAGMSGLILTCKHHDGFCLWPSKYTGHSVAASPYRGGSGDVVREVSEACRREGLKFGIYLSPWDRNHAAYGSGRGYDDYYLNQLTELLTGYGDIFCVWMDGACGEGPNGRRQVYDWNRYYACIRQLQPEACICVCGPDIRWCGNEAGATRPAEWSVVPARLATAERVQENSQQCDDEAFRQQSVKSSDLDLGSRRALANETELIWYPAEVNTSIRPGWFYHESENGKQKTAAQLRDIYYRSAGGNATFLLNLPPMPNGRLHEQDVAVLAEFGRFLKTAFSQNLLAREGTMRASAALPGHGPSGVLHDDYDTWYQPPEGVTSVSLEFILPEPRECRHLVLKENIWLSQRIEAFQVELYCQGRLTKCYQGTAVGYRKIIPLQEKADKIIINITDARVCPTLSFVGIYGPAEPGQPKQMGRDNHE